MTRIYAIGKNKASPRSIVVMRTNRQSCSGFTLIELLVVLTLLSIIAGMTLVRIDGASEGARLQACMSSHSSVLKLAAVQARCSGEPRLVSYEPGSLLLYKPVKQSGVWEWDGGMSFDFPSGVRTPELITDRDAPSTQKAIRVNADGRVPEHAVIYQVHDRFLTARFSSFRDPQFLLSNRRPEFSSWSNLVEVIAQNNEKP